MGADAKIDLEKVRLSMGDFSSPANPRAQNVIQITRPPVPVYQTVIEKTRGLAFRAQAMGVALERTAHAPAAPAAEAAPAPVSAAA
jgi:translation initiation factor 3 subunit E